MIPQATLGVEVQPMSIPKPMQLAVVVDGKPIAWMAYEDAKKAVEQYQKLKEAYEASL